MDRRTPSPSPTTENAPLSTTRALNMTPRTGFRPLRMATTAPRSSPRENSTSSPGSTAPLSTTSARSNSPRLGTIQKIGRGKTMDVSGTPPVQVPPRSPRFPPASRSSTYSIRAESESTTASPKSTTIPLDHDVPTVTESPPSSPRMLNRVSASPAFASLSAALGLDADGELNSATQQSSQLSRPTLTHHESSTSAYSRHVVDDSDSDDDVGRAVDANDAPGSAQTATFPDIPAPPPVIGNPPGADKSKGAYQSGDSPKRFQTISLANEDPDTPSVRPADTSPALAGTPQFQAVELDDETDKHGTPHIQPVDLDKTIDAGRVQSSSSDSWGISRQSTVSTMTTLSLGGKSVSSISGESTDSSRARKVRPDSLILTVKPGEAPLIHCVAVVDFNHLVGPRIEFAYPPIPDSSLPPPPPPSDPETIAPPPNTLLSDPAIQRILPFLALPDGAHLSAEDYAYFHVVKGMKEDGSMEGDEEGGDTIFAISCNRQLAASELLTRGADVTRSTVQKAIVVLARKPLFGAIRDRLGVVTRAYFGQRDFSETGILVDFYHSLEKGLRSQLTESGLYMGTSLRELIHKFRHRTLTLLKLLMLQKRIMFYGHPVERLCTYQYSLISLIPGLLLALEDAGAPSFDRRATDTERPSELRTSDRKSLMRFMGCPLNLFGAGAFFQPYMPLQQVDMLKSEAWLCGTTNTIVTQQKNSVPDLLVNLETNTFEYSNPNVERLGALTGADRKFIDDLVKDVNDGWNEADPSRPLGMQFKGSDDYLRTKFEEYIYTALSTVKYADFLNKGKQSEVLVPGTAADAVSVQHFGEPWVAAFRTTKAYAHWNRVTDPVLFDIIEPKHLCAGQVTFASDIGLRLSEGLNDLKLEENLGPARDRIASAISTGSTGFFKAFGGFRSDVSQRLAPKTAPPAAAPALSPAATASPDITPTSPPALAQPATSPQPVQSTWGSFFASKAASFRQSRASTSGTSAIGSAPGTPEIKAADVKSADAKPADIKDKDGKDQDEK
ncbi:Late Secretory pathway protein AVL9 [Ceratobasidium sp. AG-Ba]|nr:Late Secretory pathway protein AVL9 [Ceratobasidium sp. AG-Ba]